MVTPLAATASFAGVALAALVLANILGQGYWMRALAHTAIASSVAAALFMLDLASRTKFSWASDIRLEQGVIRDCPDCPEMTVVMGGDVDMQVDGTKVRERIWPGFAIGRQEVSSDEFEAFLRQTGRPASVCAVSLDARAGNRAVCVSRTDAAAYVAWLTQQTGRAYRLPTAVEWAHAAAATTATQLRPSTGSSVMGMHDGTAEMVDDCEGNCTAALRPPYATSAETPDGRTGLRVVRDIRYDLMN
jgi:hypothetical protein